jgi:hypothetical protein
VRPLGDQRNLALALHVDNDGSDRNQHKYERAECLGEQTSKFIVVVLKLTYPRRLVWFGLAMG